MEAVVRRVPGETVQSDSVGYGQKHNKMTMDDNSMECIYGM